MSSTRTSYPPDVSVEAWAFVAPYYRSTTCARSSNALRYLVRQRYVLVHWEIVYQQYRCWLLGDHCGWRAGASSVRQA